MIIVCVQYSGGLAVGEDMGDRGLKHDRRR